MLKKVFFLSIKSFFPLLYIETMKMDRFNKDIYEKLLADDHFVEWASGKKKELDEHWSEWKKEHPEYTNEFEEAYKSVALLKFNPPAVSDKEVSYLWMKTRKNIDKLHSITPLQKTLIWYGRVAGVLIIPLMAIAIWFFQTGKLKVSTGQMAENTAVQKAAPVTIKAPVGGRLNFEFPDGSKVWLNSGSEIKYPVSFSGKAREVELLGEAVFEIEKSEKPFIVHNPGPDVKVYGTVFSISSYDDSKDIVVALVEGKVALGLNGKEVMLKPGEVSVYNKKEKQLNIMESNNIDRYIAWREGKLIFRDTKLSEIAKVLQHNYNVSITLMNSKIANYRYNATFENETLDQILYILTLTAPVKYTYIKPERNANCEITKAEVRISEDNRNNINR